MPIRFSFIVPFHRELSFLARCLDALDPLPPESELIVAADGAVEDCEPLAAQHGARVVALDGPSGPAVARNVAAAVAQGDVLVFVDSDVVVSRQGLSRMTQILCDEPRTAAVFGAYDEDPADPGFVSQYKNLSHSFIHQTSDTRARTFWTGFGALRREAFCRIGGFDERILGVEDIDLGYRLTMAGFEVKLDPSLSACHLKRWTFGSMIATDIRNRGIPWTQLILRYGAVCNDLNLRARYRWSVVLAYMALLSTGLAIYDLRYFAGVPLLVLGLTLINRRYYEFFYQKRGASFAIRAWMLHTLHHLYNGVSFLTGSGLFVAARYFDVRLPGALSTDSWDAARSRSAAARRTPAVWSTDPAS